jgi:hypothetical protein
VTERAELLELLHGGGLRFERVHAEFRTWRHEERANDAWEARARESKGKIHWATTIDVDDDEDIEDEPDAESEGFIRVWLDGESQQRKETLDEEGPVVLKLAINISLAVQMLAFSEGLRLAERDGVDVKLAADVMTESPIGSPMLKAREPLVLELPDDAWFNVGLMDKDIRLALDLGRELDVRLASARAADEALTRATELGYEGKDIAALFQVLGRSGAASEEAGPSKAT